MNKTGEFPRKIFFEPRHLWSSLNARAWDKKVLAGIGNISLILIGGARMAVSVGSLAADNGRPATQ